MIIICDRGIKCHILNIRCVQLIMSAIDSALDESEESLGLACFTFIWCHNHIMIDTYEWYIYR